MITIETARTAAQTDRVIDLVADLVEAAGSYTAALLALAGDAAARGGAEQAAAIETAAGTCATIEGDATYTYSIFDADPDASSVSPLDDCEDIEIEACSVADALSDVRDALEIAAAGCSSDDGYYVDGRLYAIVRMPDGTVEKLSHTLTEDDLG